MWIRGAAIRPVPPHAVIPDGVLEGVERDLAADAETPRGDVNAVFARFCDTQPELSDYIAAILSRPLDDTALGLGHFLSLAVWLAFDRAFGSRLQRVSADALRATLDAMKLEEDLRAEHAEEPLDVEDVMTVEQPRVLAFVNEHVDAALEVGDAEDAGAETDVDDVHIVFRATMVLTLSLSHAVKSEAGAKIRELLA